jgi:hypothetical protein
MRAATEATATPPFHSEEKATGARNTEHDDADTVRDRRNQLH